MSNASFSKERLVFDENKIKEILIIAFSFQTVDQFLETKSLNSYTENDLKFVYNEVRDLFDLNGKLGYLQVFVPKSDSFTRQIKKGYISQRSKGFFAFVLYVLYSKNWLDDEELKLLHAKVDHETGKSSSDDEFIRNRFETKLKQLISGGIDAVESPNSIKISKKTNEKSAKKPFWLVAFGLSTVAVFLLITKNRHSETTGRIELSEWKHVTEGLTTRVFVKYDFSQIKNWKNAYFLWNDGQTDSIKLTSNKGSVSHLFTGQSNKLVFLNVDQIKDSLYLPIKSNGWYSNVYFHTNRQEPRLINTWDFRKNGIFHIDKKDILDGTIRNLQNFGVEFEKIDYFNIDADNMALETKMKNPVEEGGLACFDQGVTLNGVKNGQKGSFAFALLGKGCSQYSHLKVGHLDVGFGTKTPVDSLDKFGNNFLRNFEYDTSNWTTIKIKTYNHNLEIYVGDKQIVKTTYTGFIGKLRFIQLGFRGSGSADYIKIKNLKGQILYQDDF